MFNFITNLLGAFHNRPNISYIAPKTINVYFRNSIDPKYILLNINKYDYCEFDIVSQKQGDNNLFALVATLHGATLDKVELAQFETRKEAETALLVLRNKLFAFDKGLIKATVMILILVMLGGLFADLSGATLRRFISAPTQPTQYGPMAPTGQVPPFMLPPNAGVTDVQELQKQLQDRTNQAIANTPGMANPPFTQDPVKVPTETRVVNVDPNGAPQAQAAPLPEVATNPEVNNFVNSLGK